MLLIAAGLVWFAQVSADGKFLTDILGPELLAAAGLGFAFVPVTIAAVAGVSDQDSGLASGLINTSQQVGGALGLAVLAAVANAGITGAATPQELTDGFQNAFLVGAGIAALGAVLAAVLIRTADSRQAVEAEPVPAAG